MKKLLYIFLSAAIALSISACGADDIAVAETVSIDSLIAESKKETNQDGSYTVSDFDANGREIRNSRYTAEGTLEDCSVYEYDDKGNNIRRTLYTADNQIDRRTEYEYDENGNRTLMTMYGSDGEMITWSEYK